MKRRINYAFWLFVLITFLATSARCSTTTLTGTIYDSQSNPLNGTLTMTLPAPASDGVHAYSPVPVSFRVENGSIVGGAPLLDLGSAGVQPKGLWYAAKAYDQVGNLAFYGNYVVTGASYDLGAAVPTIVTTSNISYINPASLSGNNIFTGNNTFTGTTNFPGGISGIFNILGSTVSDSATVGGELTTSGCWTSTGWTGSYLVGFTHTPGNSDVLSCTIPGLAPGQSYQVSFDVAMTTGGVLPQLGGNELTDGTNSIFYVLTPCSAGAPCLVISPAACGTPPSSCANLTYPTGPQIYTGDPLTFTPVTYNSVDTDVTISNISVKLLSAMPDGPFTLTDSGAVLSDAMKALTSSLQDSVVGAGSGNLLRPNSGKPQSAGYNALYGYTAGKYLSTGQQNSFFGQAAGYNTDSGLANTFIGSAAGYSNTVGGQNTFIGVSAGRNNTIGSEMVCVGYDACLGSAGQVAAGITAVGDFAGFSETTGSSNGFFGFQSGFHTTTGNANLFMGQYTGFNNATGSSNTVVGGYAGQTMGAAVSYSTLLGFEAGRGNTASNSTFVGANAGQVNTGDGNTFTGFESGMANIAGTHNSFFGNIAGLANITGTDNTFFGYAAGTASTGSGNSFIGSEAGLHTTTGQQNAFTGFAAGQQNTTANYNAFFGGLASELTTTGGSNTAIGFGAGYTATPANANVTGSNNTWVGFDAGPGTTSQLSNTTAVGSGALNSVSNQVMLGDPSVTQLCFAGGTICWYYGAGAPGINCTVGSLYSNTSGGASTTLYVCTATNTWTAK